MGSVYRARRPDLDREVALKVISPGLVTDRRLRTRFRREAKALSLVRHPHVVALLDADVEGEVPYLALELVTGHSLEREIGPGLPVWETARVRELGRQVAAGLAALHGAGVVHRDLKPSNVLCDADGRFVLTDFGLVAGQQFTKVTAEGDMVGTPAYMAPECFRAGELTYAADVFQLGVLLFEAARSSPPFGRDLVEIARRAAAGELAAGSFEDPALGAVIVRCLQYEPADRPPDGRAVLALLEGRPMTEELPRPPPALAESPPTPGPPPLPGPPPARGGPGLGVAVGGFLAVAAISALWPGGGTEGEVPVLDPVALPGERELELAWRTPYPARTRATIEAGGGRRLEVEREGPPATEHRLRLPWLGPGPQRAGPGAVRLPVEPVPAGVTRWGLEFPTGTTPRLVVHAASPAGVALEAGGRVRAESPEPARVHGLELGNLGPLDRWPDAVLVLTPRDGRPTRVPLAGGLAGLVGHLEDALAALAARLPPEAPDPGPARLSAAFDELRPLLARAFAAPAVGAAGGAILYRALAPFERLDRAGGKSASPGPGFGAADLAAPFARPLPLPAEAPFPVVERFLFEGSTGVGREGSTRGWLAEPRLAWGLGPPGLELPRQGLEARTGLALPARPLEEIAARIVIPGAEAGRLELGVAIEAAAPGTGLEVEVEGRLRLRFLLEPPATRGPWVAAWSLARGALPPGSERVLVRAVALPGAPGLPALVPRDLRVRVVP